jgi:undecaprenyl diphosphate synthase
VGGELKLDEFRGRQHASDATSFEMRISNFLLWQIAYSEIYITPTYWPDFRLKHLLEALVEHQKRDRRYGGI